MTSIAIGAFLPSFCQSDVRRCIIRKLVGLFVDVRNKSSVKGTKVSEPVV